MLILGRRLRNGGICAGGGVGMRFVVLLLALLLVCAVSGSHHLRASYYACEKTDKLPKKRPKQVLLRRCYDLVEYCVVSSKDVFIVVVAWRCFNVIRAVWSAKESRTHHHHHRLSPSVATGRNLQQGTDLPAENKTHGLGNNVAEQKGREDGLGLPVAQTAGILV